jgi:hypothetical protein
MAKPKHQRGKGIKAAAHDKSDKIAEEFVSDPSGDPLRAFPADPPQRNFALLVISAVLFAAWFSFLAYVALRG